MRRFLFLVALSPLVGHAVEPTAPSNKDLQASFIKESRQIIPLQPGVALVAENLKTYLIPCHPQVATTVYFDDKVLDVKGPAFWMEGSPVELNPTIHKWVFSFNNDNTEGANYITLFPNPYLEQTERRNLNIVCKGKVFSIEPYAVANEAAAARMVYFRSTPEPERERRRAPEGASSRIENAAGLSSPTEQGQARNQSLGGIPSEEGSISRVSTLTPAVKNHGATANVLISYLQKCKILAGLPNMEMPGIEVLDKHFPAADLKGIKSGILSLYRDSQNEMLGAHCYLKNGGTTTVTMSGGNLSVRVGEKVWLTKVTDPNDLTLKPGDEAHFFAVFQDRDIPAIDLQKNRFELIATLSEKAEPMAAGTKAPSHDAELPTEPVTLAVATGYPAGTEAVLARVVRSIKGGTTACMLLVSNRGQATIDLSAGEFTVTEKGRTVRAFKLDAADGFSVAPGETKGFMAYLNDAGLAEAPWIGRTVSISLNPKKESSK